VTPEVPDGWYAARRTPPGGQSVYSELAIEAGMMLRLVFHLALRQTEGLMGSIFSLLGVLLSTPDHSTLSRRARTMKSISKGCFLPDGPIHLLIDSRGLKVFGAGEWLQDKRGTKARRTWRNLHLAVDSDTGMIIATTLTGNDVGDPSQVAPLLDHPPNEAGNWHIVPILNLFVSHEDAGSRRLQPVAAEKTEGNQLMPSRTLSRFWACAITASGALS